MSFSRCRVFAIEDLIRPRFAVACRCRQEIAKPRKGETAKGKNLHRHVLFALSRFRD
jgi:hypothetical protein